VRWLKRLLITEVVHRFYAAKTEEMPALTAGVAVRSGVAEDEPLVAAAFPRVPYLARLATGDRVWLAFRDGRLAHQTWTSVDRAFIPQVAYDRRLGPDEVYVYDCVTLEPFRGLGIYPATVVHAARAHLALGRTRAVLGILSGNDPSMRGAEKAAFRPEFDHHFYDFLGFQWQRERPCTPGR
jgi:hypothetical protein